MERGDTTGSRKSGPPSGRFLLRLDAGLHASLRSAARRAGLSLNEYCVRRLQAEPAGLTSLVAPARAVGRAVALFGSELVGVVAYGSWTRGEAVAGSDVDLFVVVERSVRIRRVLYRTWDEEPLEWEGRAVDAHFVHLPEPDAPVAGVWAEASLDGIVLFDETLRLSTYLARVRREIAEGRLVRRTSHGQPYWVASEVA